APGGRVASAPRGGAMRMQSSRRQAVTNRPAPRRPPLLECCDLSQLLDWRGCTTPADAARATSAAVRIASGVRQSIYISSPSDRITSIASKSGDECAAAQGAPFLRRESETRGRLAPHSSPLKPTCNEPPQSVEPVKRQPGLRDVKDGRAALA